MKAGVLALAILLAAPGCSAEAEVPARPEGPVLDQADILPLAEEAVLDGQLRELSQRTGDALVVVSVNSLGGRSIDDYAQELFNTWGIGDAETDRGALILLAPNERQMRIHVGCGLEATLTDQAANNILFEKMAPHFVRRDYRRGVAAGVEAVIARMALPAPANDVGPRHPACAAETARTA